MRNKKRVEIFPAKEIKVSFDKVQIKEKVLGVIERRARPFGNGAMVTCPSQYLNRKVYLVVV